MRTSLTSPASTRLRKSEKTILSREGLFSFSFEGGFLIVRPPLHLLEQAILEHQLFERLERWLDLIVAHVDLHGSRHSSVLRREDPHFQGRSGRRGQPSAGAFCRPEGLDGPSRR